MDYLIFYKESYSLEEIKSLGPFRLFISSFDECERTINVAKEIVADDKIWLIFPHYKIKEERYPKDFRVYFNSSYKEDDFFQDFINENIIKTDISICIDITGFIRPHLLFLLKYLEVVGVKKVELLYSEPKRYLKADETSFSGFIDDIRIIEGCTSVDVNPQTDNDLLIIAAGYDDNLIAKVSQEKNYCKKKYYIIGFPSLQPDMYQESIFKIYSAKESIGENITPKYAPAFDPFITAQMIHNIVEENPNASNIYLSPLSTKPQAVGMILYYIWNYPKHSLNIIFPFSNHYTSKNALGIKRTWKYTFEFP